MNLKYASPFVFLRTQKLMWAGYRMCSVAEIFFSQPGAEKTSSTYIIVTNQLHQYSRYRPCSVALTVTKKERYDIHRGKTSGLYNR